MRALGSGAIVKCHGRPLARHAGSGEARAQRRPKFEVRAKPYVSVLSPSAACVDVAKRLALLEAAVVAVCARPWSPQTCSGVGGGGRQLRAMATSALSLARLHTGSEVVEGICARCARLFKASRSRRTLRAASISNPRRRWRRPHRDLGGSTPPWRRAFPDVCLDAHPRPTRWAEPRPRATAGVKGSASAAGGAWRGRWPCAIAGAEGDRAGRGVWKRHVGAASAASCLRPWRLD